MTHDIRNMNQIALGYQELLENTPNLDEASKELVTNTIKAIDSVTRLIDDVKKMKVVSDKLVEHTVVSLNDVLLQVIKPFRGIEGVTIKYSPTSDDKVQSSPLISDAFLNIVNNAIKHSNKPITIDIRVNGQTENGKKCYRVTIEDNGPGIPDDRKKTIFERHVSRQKGYSSGIGLSLVRAIIEDLHGKVWVQDRIPGDYRQGSRFVVLLPAITS
jgi:signal transduction histidine kinase